MLALVILSVFVSGFLLFAILSPSKKASGRSSGPTMPDLVPWHNSAAVDNRSLRQRQMDEDAALLSDEFARFEDSRYRAEVRDRAARAFAPPAPPAAIAGPAASATVPPVTRPAQAAATA